MAVVSRSYPDRPGTEANAASYIVYIGVIALYFGIVYFLYLETKGCTIEEVGTIFDKRSRETHISPDIESSEMDEKAGKEEIQQVENAEVVTLR